MNSFRTAAMMTALVFQPVFCGEEQDFQDLFARADKLTREGQYLQAHAIAVELPRAAERLGKGGSRHAAALNLAGQLCQFLGRYEEAENAYRRALPMVEHDGGQRHLTTRVLQNLSSLYMEHGARYAQAVRLLHRALDVGTELLGRDNPDVGSMLANLGAAHLMLQHDVEAREFLDRGLAILEKHAATYRAHAASVLSNLGVLTFRQRDPARALPYFVRAVAEYEQSLGDRHPELLKALVNLGRVYLELKRSSMAEEPLRRAVTIVETLGPEHPMLREVLSSYAVALRKNGKKEEGRQMEARAKVLEVGGGGNLTVHVSDLMGDARRGTAK